MIASYRQWRPDIADTAWIADSAEVLGRVWIGEKSGIWYQCVLRGDVHDIRVGTGSNIQDHTLIHTSEGVTPCVVGDRVTVGHRVILHGCEIQDECLVGMGAVVMDRAVLESGCLLGAGSLVPEGKVLRGGYLYAGVPARERRELNDDEKAFLPRSAAHYVALARLHRTEVQRLG